MRIAVYGGSFDPPHMGHYFSIIYLLRSELVDQVWVEPASDKHPFGKKLSSFAHRSEMLVEMTDDIRGTRPCGTTVSNAVQVRDHETCPDATGYSVDLMRMLNTHYPQHDFRIAYGSDLFHARHKFRNWDALCALAKPIFLKRAGYPIDLSELPAGASLLPLEMLDVSSTAIRNMIEKGEDLRGYIHPRVLDLLGNRS